MSWSWMFQVYFPRCRACPLNTGIEILFYFQRLLLSNHFNFCSVYLSFFFLSFFGGSNDIQVDTSLPAFSRQQFLFGIIKSLHFISAFLAVFIPLLLYCSVKSILPWVPCNLFHFWDYVLFYFFPEFSKYSFCIYCFCFVHFPSELPNLWFEVGVFFPPICKYWFKEV